MTNCNYTQLSNKQLVDCIKSIDVDIKHFTNKYLYKHYPELISELVRRTNFLDDVNHINARLYCLINNLTQHPTCSTPGCSNKVVWNRHLNKFQEHCSCKCAQTDRNVRLKNEKTCEERYGVKYGGASDQAKSKSKDTCLNKYGTEYSFQSEIVKQRIKDTNIRKYGVDNPGKSPMIIFKMEQSMMECYGVKHYAQSLEFHQKAHKKYTNPKYPDMTFGSRWEFKVYDFLIENSIEFEYQLEPIQYEYDGKTYYYIPDFLVNGRIYEVKGDNFFRINESTGKEEMFCPWGRKKLGEEKWNWLCGKYEAKHQCMLKNNVIILRNYDIENISLSTLHIDNLVV